METDLLFWLPPAAWVVILSATCYLDHWQAKQIDKYNEERIKRGEVTLPPRCHDFKPPKFHL